jgi:predicted dehydrogenase
VKTTRRSFLRTAAASGIAFPLISTGRAAPGSGRPLRVGGIGIGGKGWSDIIETTKENAQVVAICDIDRQRLAKAAKRFPGAKQFTDWRKLLEMEELDAVTVSTPDHTHAPATMTAIRRGLHVYCQKPLTHSVWEARQIGLATAKHKVVTQMGNQSRTAPGAQVTFGLLRRKAIGRIREIHMWTNRPIWPQGLDRLPTKPVPGHVAWDEWLGVAPAREYHDSLHPFKWRGWLDFGTGALGDIGCHALAPTWDGLEMAAPLEVWSSGKPPNEETFPKKGVVHYNFAATGISGGPFRLTWYDGGELPDRGLFPFMPKGWQVPDNGKLIIGEEGCMYGHHLYPREKFAKYDYPKPETIDHYQQWTLACLDRSLKTVCPFDAASGPLTEAVLLGNVALRFPGKKLKWDSEAFSFPQMPEADGYLRRSYRDGWGIDGLG